MFSSLPAPFNSKRKLQLVERFLCDRPTGTFNDGAPGVLQLGLILRGDINKFVPLCLGSMSRLENCRWSVNAIGNWGHSGAIVNSEIRKSSFFLRKKTRTQ